MVERYKPELKHSSEGTSNIYLWDDRIVVVRFWNVICWYTRNAVNILNWMGLLENNQNYGPRLQSPLTKWT